MFVGSILLFVGCVSANSWRWPDSEAEDSVRIDSKVGFVDSKAEINKRGNQGNIQADELPFEKPLDTEGFYNRPADSGRYPVRVEGGIRNQNYESDGTLDSLQYCKCVSTPDCQVRPDNTNACGPNQYLCCYNRPGPYQSEYFNEVDGDRPMLFPNRENLAGPFPPRPFTDNNGVFSPGLGQDDNLNGAFNNRRPPQVLVGPNGPTGSIGPLKRPVLVGPGGPTGNIGPETTGVIRPSHNNRVPTVLVGPNDPTGEIGPSETAQRGVLVGPGGPTGIIGPAYNRPILVGPGGPTGIIGPRRQGLLVGPGGPTGFIGPNRYNRPSQRPGILVGPGGPTGIIGPGRQLLVGPGGPTGIIGPMSFGK